LQQGAPELPKDDGDGPQFGPARLTADNLRIVDELRLVSRELGRSMAQIAINWVANRPAVSSVILGASKPEQLAETLQSLDFEIPTVLRERLDKVGKPAPQFPYTFFSPSALRRIYGDTTVTAKPPEFWR
jgi:aryl-alcohol dehydrogenase-like predicted oxidoreductase